MSNSNAPFVSTKKYPLVTGVSNSPFTDQRAVDPGGGGGGLGNVIYNGTSLSFDNGTGSNPITSINNTTNSLTIQNDVGQLNFNSATNTVSLTSDAALTLSSIGNVRLAHSGQTGNVIIEADASNAAGQGNITLETLGSGGGGNGNINLTSAGLTNITADSTVSISTEFSAIVLQGGISTNPTQTVGGLFRLENTQAASMTDINRIDLAITTQGGNEPTFRFRNNTNANDNSYIRFTNNPTTSGEVLTWNGGGDGTLGTPYELEWDGGTIELNSLDIAYDTESSVLVLSDPVDGVISTTSIVPGRTVLIKDVVVNGTTELSALGLSNSIFPPPLAGQTGYWDGLIGNSPPRVNLNPTTGLTNWFPGASFKISLAGEITKIGGYDDIILKVYSNRGQTSQNILNNFSMVTRSVNPPPKLGWNWVIDFTCRSVNDGNVLGVIATSSSFNYTDDSYILETYGAIVSNTNSSFDTSDIQYLDCTIEFDYYNQSNNIKTTLCTIERIF